MLKGYKESRNVWLLSTVILIVGIILLISSSIMKPLDITEEVLPSTNGYLIELSPNGQYVLTQEASITGSPYETYSFSLCVLDMDGTKTIISDNTRDYCYLGESVFSFDSSKVAYTLDIYDSSGFVQSELWVVDITGDNLQQINLSSSLNTSHLAIESIAFGVDSTSLLLVVNAMTNNSPNSLIYYNPNTANYSEIHESSESIYSAVFNNDGTMISYYDGEGNIYLLNSDGTNLRIVVEATYSGFSWTDYHSPSFNSNGTYLAFVQHNGFGSGGGYNIIQTIVIETGKISSLTNKIDNYPESLQYNSETDEIMYFNDSSLYMLEYSEGSLQGLNALKIISVVLFLIGLGGIIILWYNKRKNIPE